MSKFMYATLFRSSALAAATASQAAAVQTPASSTGHAGLSFLLVVAVLAGIIIEVAVSLLKKGEPSVIRSFGAPPQTGPISKAQNWLLNKMEADDGATVICGGKMVLEELDDEGYTIMSQPLALSSVQEADHIVVIPPRGIAEPLFETGQVIQTICLKPSANILTVPHCSPLAIYQRSSDGRLALMANSDNRNPTTLANGGEIDRMLLDDLVGKVFYCGDQALIIRRLAQNCSQKRAVTYKGERRSAAAGTHRPCENEPTVTRCSRNIRD